MITWITTNWVALGGIALLILRIVESIAVLLRAKKVLSVIAVIKEFCRIG